MESFRSLRLQIDAREQPQSKSGAVRPRCQQDPQVSNLGSPIGYRTGRSIVHGETPLPKRTRSADNERRGKPTSTFPR